MRKIKLIKTPYIRESRKFYGKYEVVGADGIVIPCYNFATALSIKNKIIEEQYARSAKKT